MKQNQKDPLSVLFTDETRTPDRQLLATLVAPFLSIDQSSKTFGVLPAFSRIDGNMSRLEIFLAAAKARALYLNEPDGLLPREIIEAGIMATGSVKSCLKKLFETHKIKKDKEGRYFIPSYRISELIKQFTNPNQ